MSGIILKHPWALFLLALIIPYGVYRYHMMRGRALPYPPLQYFPLPPIRKILPYLPLLLETFIIVFIVLALAGPFKQGKREFISEEGVDVALAMDISASMQAADFPPNRLEAMKKLSVKFIKRSGGNRIAVYAFAKYVFTQTPLTVDRPVIIQLIDGIAYEMINHYESGGTAIGDLLLRASDGLMAHRIKGRDQVIVLLTDGESNVGVDPLTAAKVIRENNIRLYIIGIGGDKAVEVYINGKPFINKAGKILKTKLDDTSLKEIARTAGGVYDRAKNINVLSKIFRRISRLETTPIKVDEMITEKSYRPYINIVIFILFLFYIVTEGIFFRRPYR